jgi:cysteine desulfurase
VIYFDNNATTKPDERVVAAVNAALASGWGNPSSHYELGGAARRIVEDARAELARLVGASGPGAVIFTSGGTESINTAIHAAMRAHPGRRRLLSSTVEHSAVLRTLDRLPRQGREVVHVGVDGAGALDAAAAVAALDERTALVSLQLANNETGVLLDPDGLHSIVGRARACGAWVHLDAVQAVGKVPVDFQSLGVDLLSVSAHKFHGPKGVGALVVRPGIRIEALLSGGPQEDERRAGTENVPGLAGLGAAATSRTRAPVSGSRRSARGWSAASSRRWRAAR